MVLRYLMTRTWMSIVCLFVAIPEATRAVFALGYRLSCHVNFDIDAAGCSDPVVIFRQGANIDLACRVVAFSGFATLLVAFVLWSDAYWGKRKQGRGLAVLLFLEAAVL